MKANSKSAKIKGILDLIPGLVAGCLILFSWLYWPVAWKIDQMSMDWLVRMSPGTPVRDDLVFLGIDEASLNLTALDAEMVASEPILTLMKTRFPWNRKIYAATVEKLLDAGAKLVILDLAFAEPSDDPDADQALADVAERYKNRVVLASVWAPIESMQGIQMTIVEPMAELFGETEPETACGYANFWVDPTDLSVRKAHFTQTKNEANGQSRHPDEDVYLSLAAESARLLGYPSPGDSRWLKYSTAGPGIAEDYPPLSLYSLFAPDSWEKTYENGAWFKDKIVLIGASSPRLHDEQPTPHGLIRGGQLHLQTLACVMENSFLKPPIGPWWNATSILLATGAGLFLAFRISHWGISTGSALFLIFLLFVISWTSLRFFAIFPGWLGGSLALILVMAIAQAQVLVREKIQRAHLARDLRRFVSRDVAEEIVRDPDSWYQATGGRRRDIAILFSDVRGFTSRAEREDASRLVPQLNEYFKEWVDSVFRHQGTFDKFIGDAVMATWGSLGRTNHADAAARSVNTATEMLKILEKLNAQWATQGLEPFHIGIGIHVGEATVGLIGSKERSEFTAIGDAVNLASRVEGLTKKLKTPLLFTETVAEWMNHPDHILSLGRFRVAGRREPIGLCMPRPSSLCQEFLDGIRLLANGDRAAAMTAFQAAGAPPHNFETAAAMAKLLENQLENPDPQQQDVIILDEK
jgi:adenylate cyclase